MPEFFRKMLGLDVPPAKNLALCFTDTKITGAISSATAKHRVEKITKYNREEIGEVKLTPAPAVNNGVSVALEGSSRWTVTGTSYVNCLTIAPEAAVQAPEGKRLLVTVDGQETSLTAGEYKGQITLQVL